MILLYLKKLNENALLSFFLILLIFIIGLCARVVLLHADPPSFLSHLMDYTDEAGKAHNARNFVLYGHYIVDEFNEPIFSYPCYTIFLSLFLKIFGVHLVTVRLFSILCCSITFWLIFLIMRREKFDNTEILFAVLFYWISSFYLFLNRIGFIEPFLFLWFVLMYGAIRFGPRSRYGVIGAGVFFAAALFSKAFAVIILPSIAACLLFNAHGLAPDRVKNYFYFILGAAVASALFYLFVVRIDPDEYVKFNSSILNASFFISSFGRFFPNLINEYRDIFVLAQFPLTAAFCAAFLMYHLTEDLLREKRFLLFILLWFFGGLLFLSLITYRPSRYYLLIVPPASILAGIGVSRFLMRIKRGLPDYLYCISVMIGVIFAALLPLRNFVTIGDAPGVSMKLVAEASIAAGLFLWLIVYQFRLKRFLSPIVLVGILCFLVFNAAVVYRAYSNPRYETARVSGFIREMIGGRDALITGRVDEFIFNEKRYNGHVPYRLGRDFVVYSQPWTHLFEEKTGPLGHRLNFRRAMEKNKIMERAVLLGSIRTDIMPDGQRHEYVLYEVVR